ncbi:MAG: type II toxin-antitoxin system VapC family toxin [Euryarchaeota archaeon]|nr:type II toxin-antitoxin system VapC family toxin [Euryarchaeota archaeon]
MIFIDTSIIMYAAGKPHPNKKPSVELLKLVAIGEIDAVINVEVIQEILHRYTMIKMKDMGINLAKSTLQIIPRIYSVEVSDVIKAMNILGKYNITSRDAIHVAFMINRNITEACTYDKHFFKVSEINSQTPEEIIKKYRK